MEDATPVLNIPMGLNDANAKTVGEYLRTLLLTLWQEEESFSGKRPFGNSGWKYEVFDALVKHGAIEGDVHDDDPATPHDIDSADRFVMDIIRSLFK